VFPHFALVLTIVILGPVSFFVKEGELAGTSQKIFLADASLAKKFHDGTKHVPFSTGRKKFRGSARYASLRALLKYEQSRRDDLESLGYMLVYLAKGKLPWQGFKGPDARRLLIQVKGRYPVEALCNDLPKQFQILITYCRGLEFEQKPDYQFLKELFQKLVPSDKTQYDWEV
jgi:serine/threonine protein kinase